MGLIRTVVLAVAMAFGALPGGAAENGLGTPLGPVVLTVTGEIAQANAGGSAIFDVAMLEALGTQAFETETIWTAGVQRFEGVPLAAVMDALGVADGVLVATAVNDYSVEIPVVDDTTGGPIVAFRQNGAEMSVRDKGPLWIVYPYDSDPMYRSEVIYARSIWQLDRIVVRQ